MNNSKIDLLSVARFSDFRKDIFKLFKVMKKICSNNIETHFCLNIVSPKSIKIPNYLNKIENLTIKEFINLNDRELEIIYKKKDIYLSTSIEEGFGFVIIDAIKNNCLVVSTDTAGSIEILGSNYPFLAKKFDLNAFLNKLQKAIDYLAEKSIINQDILNSLYERKIIIKSTENYLILKKLI